LLLSSTAVRGAAAGKEVGAGDTAGFVAGGAEGGGGGRVSGVLVPQAARKVSAKMQDSERMELVSGGVARGAK
jgi:hypothetical protein